MNCAPASPSQETVSLQDVPKGRKVRVFRIDSENVACQRLRELGFCEKAEIEVLTNHGPVICQVCGSRVGLSRQAANAVLVEPVS